MKCSTKPAKRDSLRRAAICILPLVLLISAAAQESTLRSPSNLVVVPPPVKGREGGIANGLSAKDFVIEDVGVEPPVRLDEAPEQPPISLVIAIQTGRRASYEFSRIQRLNSMPEPIVDAGFAEVGFVEFDSQVHAVHHFIGNPHQVSQRPAGTTAGRWWRRHPRCSGRFRQNAGEAPPERQADQGTME